MKRLPGSTMSSRAWPRVVVILCLALAFAVVPGVVYAVSANLPITPTVAAPITHSSHYQGINGNTDATCGGYGCHGSGCNGCHFVGAAPEITAAVAAAPAPVGHTTLTCESCHVVTAVVVNTPPVLAPIGNRVGDELTLITFLATATDTDIPADTLTFSLGVGAPAGAAITAGGVFTWTPTEAQGLGIYDITVIVSDGTATDSEMITITVAEVASPVNTPPVLAPIGNKSVNELATLSFLATATDVDVTDTLTFELWPVGGGTLPAGAAITSGGAFSWTPTEAQGPGTYDMTILVQDGQGGADWETFTVTVAEVASTVNTPPVLAPIGNKSVNELALLAFQAAATDTDVPANTLTFSLGAGAPIGAAITAGGAFTWTPTEAQGPGTYDITIVVSDGTATDTETITITVAEVASTVNTPPVLAPIGNKSVNELAALSFLATATDTDVPANTLTFSLGAGAPIGAAITAGGAFTWTPTEAQGPGTYDITIVVSDGTATDTETITVTVGEVSSALEVTEIEGANRIGTAIAASMEGFTSSEYVLIATGYNWPDALGGSALAGSLDAPILLTAQGTLPSEVRAEIVRLGVTKAIVLGGAPAVSAAVYSQIDAIAGVSVERISGDNRYETANAVAARTITVMGAGYDGTAFVATGVNFPDALGASPLAAAKGWPIYLTSPLSGSNPALVATMDAAGVTDALVLGGTNVVGSPVESGLASLGSVTRIDGANRYETALKVATYGVANAGLTWDKVAIATGQNFPDALAGGVLQGRSGSVILLTPTNSLNLGVAAVLTANKATISEVRFLGSTAAVSQTVRDLVIAALQ